MINENADKEIQDCLDLDKPKSFFLYAGAGSGKTRTLIDALKWIRDQSAKRLWLHGQHVSVITYTNAAVDEIKQRMEFDALIEVSTIHSFAWSLISSFQSDIRECLRQNLVAEIHELKIAEEKGRSGTKASFDRINSIKNKNERLNNLDQVKRFVYSPEGDNRSRDSLNHSEVIKITSTFLTTKPTFQNIVVNRFPILLIDESQDTNRDLMAALLQVQRTHEKTFCLGLFGDTMQRIYADGMVGLGESLSEGWARPAKLINYRCPQRILKLINRVRLDTDGQQQIGPDDKTEGFVRLFLLPAVAINRPEIEAKIIAKMAEITEDRLWLDDCKTLILEHHLAAKRLGFSDLYEPLYSVERLRTGLLDGTLSSMRLFTKDVLSLREAMRREDRFAVASVVKKKSPLIDQRLLRTHDNLLEQLRRAKEATSELEKLWVDNKVPTLHEVLLSVSKSGLFQIPEVLRVILAREGITFEAVEVSDPNEKELSSIEAWDKVLKASFEQVEAYDSYISDLSNFSTHQGVKGREFPRVLVILDDEEAKGFLFSYEKLFGAIKKSATDEKNELEGRETTIDRTRRLFYVTCSRAESSLAIVAYTSDPHAVKDHLISEKWFDENEVIESV